jgi:two-component system CheB/CheR fusion protein
VIPRDVASGDVDETASRQIATHVSEKRLQRFFVRENSGYRIRRELRERCVFARHDLVNDPPFSKLDLVSCRNLLIYLGPRLQQRAIGVMHYALNQPGFLLLGRAETVGDLSTLFREIDSEARIYARKPSTRAGPILAGAGRMPAPIRTQLAVRSHTDVQRDVDHVLLARYAPPCVLVNEAFEILQFRGHTGLYLEPPTGQPQLSVLRMARGDLATELPLALQRAHRTGLAVRKENIRIRDRRHEHCVHLEIVPIRGADHEPQFLVMFEPQPERVAPKKPARKGRERDAGELERLRHELASTKEYMHSVLTQHLATTEELGLTNEELQSTNEELQSSNEEMQTAKEELHSTNEELETVNEELHARNEQLGAVNDDLVNVLASVEIAMIIVDTERCVRRFTPTSRSVMNLIAGDVGRPIADLHPTIAVPDLDATIAAVIDSHVVHESEVEDPSTGTFYRMQVRPYLTADRSTKGAVLSFIDITALRSARNFRAAIVDTVPTPMVVLGPDLRIQSANRSFGEVFRTTEAVMIGRTLLDVGDWRSPDLQARLHHVLDGGPGLDGLEVDHHDATGVRMLRITANALPVMGDRRSILVGIEDVTEREAARRERDAFLDAVSHELRTPLSAILLWAQALKTLDADDPQRDTAIATIIDCVKSEARLVDDLLEVALSRSIELSLALEVGDPAPIVASVVEVSRSTARAKDITLSTDIEHGSQISMDPRRLEQICTKLVANAIKFTPERGTVGVSLAQANGVVTLAVRDTGLGVVANRIPHVFEPFSREDGSTSRSHAGLGIGLALVRHLVERHGGTIAVESLGVDRGSLFTVRIPTCAS